MSELAQEFIQYLESLKAPARSTSPDHPSPVPDIKRRKPNLGAFAQLKRSLGFDPGAYPPAYPYVERFVGADKHADDPWRKALYLTAGLYAFHPKHSPDTSLAAAFGQLAHKGHKRGNDSLERRFITLLGAETESLPPLLRQAVSLLAADKIPCNYVALLDDLVRWFEALHFHDERKKNRVCQQWARDFYRALEPHSAPAEATLP